MSPNRPCIDIRRRVLGSDEAGRSRPRTTSHMPKTQSLARSRNTFGGWLASAW